MRGETLEALSVMLGSIEPDLVAVLNILGEEGWEIAEKLRQTSGTIQLLLKRPGNRRGQKDAETRALMKRTLDDMGPVISPTYISHCKRAGADKIKGNALL